MIINFDEGGKVDDYQDSLVKKFGGGMPRMMEGGMPKYGTGGMYGTKKKNK